MVEIKNLCLILRSCFSYEMLSSFLCFHYHTIKNKNAYHSIQKVQNLGNERR